MGSSKPDIDLEEVERLAGQGLTVKQVGHCIGYSRSYLYEKPDIMDAIKRGRSQGVEKVTNALMDNAMTGNVTAQIFYLKNREPDKWSDRKNIDHTTKGKAFTPQPINFPDDGLTSED